MTTPGQAIRLISAVLDDKASRLKALTGRQGKKEALSFVDARSRLNLLQIATICGNVSAVEHLISIGADVNVRWTQDGTNDLGFLTTSITTPQMSRFVRLSINIVQNSLASNTLAKGAWFGGQLSLLHLAALTNQQAVVRFLVEKKHLPVDVRAEVTGVTPLLAVVTRRCMPSEGVPSTRGGSKHTCGLTSAPGMMAPCAPLTDMARLLLELGADVAAVAACGACVLAIAASAGKEGLWDYLTAYGSYAKHVPLVELARVPVHAGQVLLGLVAAYLSRSSIEHHKRASLEGVTWLRGQYDARGWADRWEGEVNEPLRRRLIRLERGEPAEMYATNALHHALDCQGDMMRGGEAARLLLDSGCSLGSLLLGRERYLITRNMPLEAWRLLARRAEGQPGGLQGAGRVLMGALVGCVFFAGAEGAPSPSAEAFRDAFARLLDAGVDFRDGRWWPDLPSIPGEGDDALAMLPLQLACCKERRLPALRGMCMLLDAQPGGRACLQGQLADGNVLLVVAADGGSAGQCSELLRRGASVTTRNCCGRHALWAVASRGDEPEACSIVSLFMEEILQLEPEQGDALTQALREPGPGNMSLAQHAVQHKARTLLANLAALGTELNVSHEGADSALRLACTAADEASVTILVGEGQSGAALRGALCERSRAHGLTVLGSVVAWGYQRIAELLADACTREGLALAPLLERHAPRSRFHAPLFTALVHRYPGMLEALLDRGLELTPAISSEHMAVMAANGSEREPTSPDSTGPSGSGRLELVPEPDPGGGTESLSLLMCAASLGSLDELCVLLGAGLRAGEKGLVHQHAHAFPRNRWFKDAVTAAIDCPDLAHFLGGDEGAGACMGSGQLACVEILLNMQVGMGQERVGMSQEQLGKVLAALPQVDNVEVARSLWRFLRRSMAVCAACGLIGKWRKCAQCRTTYYCSVACQAAHHSQHRPLCRAPLGGKQLG